VIFRNKYCIVVCSFEEELGSAGEQPISNKMNEATEHSLNKGFIKVKPLFFILELQNG